MNAAETPVRLPDIARALITRGVGAPDAVWDLSLAEAVRLLAPPRAHAPNTPDRAILEALMALFPDDASEGANP